MSAREVTVRYPTNVEITVRGELPDDIDPDDHDAIDGWARTYALELLDTAYSNSGGVSVSIDSTRLDGVAGEVES